MSLNPPIRDWQGKRVWIVGASSGIGAVLAEALSLRGALLALSGRRLEKLKAVSARIPGSIAIPLDVSDPHSILPAFLQLLDLWDGVDVVVLNVGAYMPSCAWDLAVESARTTFEINLMAVVNGTAAVLPQLLQQGEGAIVIVGSAAGFRGQPLALAYGASKAAVINFAEGLYLNVAQRGIGVFLVTPGHVGNALNGQKGLADISAYDAAKRILCGMAQGRFEIHFPRRYTLLLKFLRALPKWLYLRLGGRAADVY